MHGCDNFVVRLGNSCLAPQIKMVMAGDFLREFMDIENCLL